MMYQQLNLGDYNPMVSFKEQDYRINEQFFDELITDTEKLYLVVHHRRGPDRRGPDQSYSNSWLDNDRLEVIITNTKIAEFCQDAQHKGERVFVHRCGWAGAPSTICCSAIVARIDSLDRKMSVVRFAEQQVLDMPSPKAPHRGQCSYFAPPCC